jgi:fatty acid-binding protein DegV
MIVTYKKQHMSLNAFAKAVGLSFYKADKYIRQGMTPDQIAKSLRAALPATTLAAELGIPVSRIREMRRQGASQAEIDAEALV